MKRILFLLLLFFPLLFLTTSCKKDVPVEPDDPVWVDPTIKISVTPIKPAYGKSSVLSWEIIPYAQTIVKKASILVQGTEISSELSGNYTLDSVTDKIGIEITVLMEGKTEPVQKTLEVTPWPQVFYVPTLTVNANPSSLPIGGGTTTLSWTAQNADTVRVNDIPYGPAGSFSVNLVKDSTFIFLAIGPGGQKTVNLSVAVEPAPPVPTALDTLRSGKWYRNALYISCPEKDIWRVWFPILDCGKDDYFLFKDNNEVEFAPGEYLCEGETSYVFVWPYSFSNDTIYGLGYPRIIKKLTSDSLFWEFQGVWNFGSEGSFPSIVEEVFSKTQLPFDE